MLATKLILTLAFLGPGAGPAAALTVAAPPARTCVQQSAEAPRRYEYSVRRETSSYATLFLLGDGEKTEMQDVDENIPEKIIPPECWTGRTVFKEESIYMHVFWKRERDCGKPQPEIIEGFALEMPELTEKAEQLFHVDGTPAVPLDMRSAPFTICFADGSCFKGRVEECRQSQTENAEHEK